jgi:hypothetical protein
MRAPLDVATTELLRHGIDHLDGTRRYLMSRSPQSTQNLSPLSLFGACRISPQRLIWTPPFTTSPHDGQNRTGASARRWFMLGQLVAFMAAHGSSGAPLVLRHDSPGSVE